MSAPKANGPGQGTELTRALLMQAGGGRATPAGTGKGNSPGCPVEVGAAGPPGGHTGAGRGLGLLCHEGNSIGEGSRTKCRQLLGKPGPCPHALGFPCELEVPGARQPGRLPTPTAFGALPPSSLGRCVSQSVGKPPTCESIS